MKRHPQSMNPRRGAAVVFVLVVLLVISMFAASLVRATFAIYRQRERLELRAQTVRLAEAGLARARQQLRADPAYRGETWQLTNGELGEGRQGQVRIEPVTDQPAGQVKQFRAIAEFPVDSPLVTRATLETEPLE